MYENLHSALVGIDLREGENSLQKVDDADTELTEALKSAETSADIIKGVGKFLTVVDKAIDLAKTLAPLAV